MFGAVAGRTSGAYECNGVHFALAGGPTTDADVAKRLRERLIQRVRQAQAQAQGTVQRGQRGQGVVLRAASEERPRSRRKCTAGEQLHTALVTRNVRTYHRRRDHNLPPIRAAVPAACTYATDS